MKQLLFIFSIALVSCGTSSNFVPSYNSNGSQYGNQILAQSGINTMTRLKSQSQSSQRIIVNPGSTSGSMCPGTSGQIVRPTRRPSNTNAFNSTRAVQIIVNEIVTEMKKRPSQRIN